MWNRPLAGAPGSTIDVIVREPDPTPLSNRLRWTKEIRKCINLGSYNYLGFSGGEEWDKLCKKDVLGALDAYGSSVCCARLEGGVVKAQIDLEKEIARFVGKPAAVVFSMGYDTNASSIPSLIADSKGSLLISDSLNHTSIVNGARSSGAMVKVFRHNDVDHLDQVLKDAILHGQPLTRRPWKKILVVVEGIYSMEGEVCNLKEIVRVCKKYKAYIYVDEAHSIGALGETGRGVCEHTGVDPNDIDILMGTFTKSFGAMGGYIASSPEIIAFLKSNSAACAFSTSMSGPVCQQILNALKIISGEDGTDIGKTKLKSVKDNANYFREELIKMGCEVLGDRDSPVIPLMLCKCSFSFLCNENDIAIFLLI